MICVFAIVLDGHADMFSTWQPGVVLAMTDLVIQSRILATGLTPQDIWFIGLFDSECEYLYLWDDNGRSPSQG